MLDLYLLNETFTNGSSHGLLYFVTLASISSGVFVIVIKNPVVSVLFLIGLFLNIASYLMLLGINFIGLSYLLVYVGAVSILFIFILMLINVRISELTTDNSNECGGLLIITQAIIYSCLIVIWIYYIFNHNVAYAQETTPVIGNQQVSSLWSFWQHHYDFKVNFLTHISQYPPSASQERLSALNQLNTAYLVIEKADKIILGKVCNNYNLTPEILRLIQSQIEARGYLD